MTIGIIIRGLVKILIQRGMNRIYALVLALALFACNDTVFDQYDRDFDNNRWVKSDVRQYHFAIADTAGRYDLIVDFSHVAGFQFGLVPISVTLQSANEQPITEHLLLRIKDANGNDIGDCTGDYCDIAHIVFSDLNLKRGKYKVSIANEFDNDYLPNVVGLGIRVQHAAKKNEP